MVQNLWATTLSFGCRLVVGRVDSHAYTRKAAGKYHFVSTYNSCNRIQCYGAALVTQDSEKPLDIIACMDPARAYYQRILAQLGLQARTARPRTKGVERAASWRGIANPRYGNLNEFTNDEWNNIKTSATSFTRHTGGRTRRRCLTCGADGRSTFSLAMYAWCLMKPGSSCALVLGRTICVYERGGMAGRRCRPRCVSYWNRRTRRSSRCRPRSWTA
jgi:hypothetical protein